MERLFWLARATVREQEALAEVRREVHEEIRNGGKRLSERQNELTGWQQRDLVPAITGIVGGCGGIAAFRKFGFMAKSKKWMILLPALPCYILPYQLFYHVRETEYLVEMMREDRSGKFSRKLRSVFEKASAARSSAVLEELDCGSDIEDPRI
mmetsp:Transcript_46235/g.93281  ORF Transcript_46235/g.93281 Transcript_46235/m.93281 type:complete len:153 (-) Transcript_46235:175-633(-)